jgi:outer membrane protein TolC
MNPKPRTPSRGLETAAAALLGILALSACALPPRPDPQFPGRHWIEKARPPMSQEIGERPAAVSADHPLTFDDCVFLAMQQAPGLVNGAVELEIARLRKDSAYWKQYPELRLVMGVTTNLTRKSGEDGGGAGETDFWVGFAVRDFNPVANYLSYEAAELVQAIAVLTHQRAVEAVAEQIGEILLRMEMLAAVRERQAALPGLAEKAESYWRTARAADDRDGLESARAAQKQRQARAALEKTDAELAALRLNLKLLLGLDPSHALQLEPAFERRFRSDPMGDRRNAPSDWEPAWEAGTETRISRLSLRLQDYQVLLAWSRYLPEIGLDLYSGDPGTTAVGRTGEDEAFAVFRLGLPLLDYGNRARGVEEARLQKTKSVESLRTHRLGFAHKWAQADRSLTLLEASRRLAEENLALARLEARRSGIEFDSGQSTLSPYIEGQEKVVQEEIRLEEAVFNLRRQKWSRYFAGGDFVRRFFAPPPGADGRDPS